MFIVALPHSLIISKDTQRIEQEQVASGGSKKCPFCAEIIKAEAVVCRYCGRDLPQNLRCPKCKTPVQADTKKCPSCGGLFKAGVEAGLTEGWAPGEEPTEQPASESSTQAAVDLPAKVMSQDELDQRFQKWQDTKKSGGGFGIGLGVFVIGLVIIMGVVFSIQTKNAVGTSVTPTPSSTTTDSQPEQTKPSPWNVSTSRNELTGETELVASNGFRDNAIIVRKRGRKFECYVTTGEFLETVQTMETGRTVVRYRFDDGQLVQQSWSLSSDNTALFYPGDPRSFLRTMSKSKKFVIEYRPSDKVPQTESFDVTPFPAELLALLKTDSPSPSQRQTTLRTEALSKVHPCKSDPGDWCWSYGEGKESVWDSKDEAVQSYVESHQK